MVLCDFNTSCDTLRITIFNTFKNNTLKTKIFDFITLVTYKLRDALFIRNKAVGLLNTSKKSKKIRKRSIDINMAVLLIRMLLNRLLNIKILKIIIILITFRPLYLILKKILNMLNTLYY